MKFKFYFFLFLFLLLFIISQNIYGQTLLYSVSPRLWGFDFYFFINDFPAKIGSIGTTMMILGIGYGHESYGYFRDSSNNPINYDENSTYSFYFTRTNIIGTVGFSFLFFYNESYGKYLTQLTFKFILDYQSYEQQNDSKSSYLSQTNLPDKEGIFQNSFLIEFYLNFLNYSIKFHSYNGIDLLLSYEIYPQFINQIADFSRFKVRLRGFLPIIESESFTAYIADRLSFYYTPTSSGYIPVSSLTAGSLGYSMRGVNWCQYEGTIAFINNLDLRIFLPKIFNQKFIIPGLILFFDCGVNDYQSLDGKLDFSLMQYSTGIGIVLALIGIDLIDFYLDYNINDSILSFKLRFALYY